jgi:maleate isomerase
MTLDEQVPQSSKMTPPATNPRRLGLLVPASDMVSEVDFHNHLPASVVYYTARLHQPKDSGIGTAANYQGLVDSAPSAAQSVALANPELLVYSCTSGSFFKGPNWHAELSKQIEDAAGIPTITTSTALITALSALGASKIFMASPYPESVNDAERAFLKAHGFDVTAVLSFGCTKSQEIFKVSPETIVNSVLARHDEISKNDALFLTCTGLRAVDVVEILEQELGIPVITSNSTALWLALSRLGIETKNVRVGRLFRQAASKVLRLST